MASQIEQELSLLRIELIDKISAILPSEQTYVDFHGLPQCAGIKYLHEGGRLSCYQAYENQLAFDHFDELPIEAMCEFYNLLCERSANVA